MKHIGKRGFPLKGTDAAIRQSFRQQHCSRYYNNLGKYCQYFQLFIQFHRTIELVENLSAIAVLICSFPMMVMIRYNQDVLNVWQQLFSNFYSIACKNYSFFHLNDIENIFLTKKISIEGFILRPITFSCFPIIFQ